MRGFQANSLKVAEHIPLKTAFCRFHDNDYNRLLVKPVKSAISLMPNAAYELSYEGAKEMLLVDEIDSKEFLTNLFDAMYEELPTPKKKK